MYSLSDQIAEAKREVSMRKSVYPNRVKAMKMSQREANTQIALMEAIVKTLESNQRKEEQISLF